MLNDGIKCKSLSLTANGTTRVLVNLQQGDENAGSTGNDYFNANVTLSNSAAWKDYFIGPFTVTTDNSITYTGGNAAFRWYEADENDQPKGDPLTTEAAYTHTFAEGETSKKIVGVDGTAQYLKTLTLNAPVVRTYAVTFVDWDDTVIKQVKVEEGKDVPTGEIPANPGMRDDGQVFKNWDHDLKNITEDTTVKAVYGEPDDGGGCKSAGTSSVGGVLGGTLLLSGTLLLVFKRRTSLTK
jgi:hypothetical protein